MPPFVGVAAEVLERGELVDQRQASLAGDEEKLLGFELGDTSLAVLDVVAAVDGVARLFDDRVLTLDALHNLVQLLLRVTNTLVSRC